MTYDCDILLLYFGAIELFTLCRLLSIVICPIWLSFPRPLCYWIPICFQHFSTDATLYTMVQTQKRNLILKRVNSVLRNNTLRTAAYLVSQCTPKSKGLSLFKIECQVPNLYSLVRKFWPFMTFCSITGLFGLV